MRSRISKTHSVQIVEEELKPPYIPGYVEHDSSPLSIRKALRWLGSVARGLYEPARIYADGPEWVSPIPPWDSLSDHEKQYLIDNIDNIEPAPKPPTNQSNK